MNAHSLTFALRGTWHRHYGLAFCPAHSNTRTPALSLRDGEDGRLLAYCHAGCSFNEIIEALRAQGLIDARDPLPTPVGATAPFFDQRKADLACRIWNASVPITGTLGEDYLRGRGISCDLPDSLRFHPACHHSLAGELPALIGLVDGSQGFAIHRTWLDDQGRKSTATPNKAMLGPVLGGAVRLSSGDGPLVACEGIETGLSLLSGLLETEATVWAALSTSGLKALNLGTCPGKLIIAADGDEPGEIAANKLGERAHAQGWKVSLLPAPKGRDWNDVLTLKGESV